MSDRRSFQSRALLLGLSGALAGALLGLADPGHAADRETYTWRNVPIGGGGYVTGMAIHPKAPSRLYIRTDVGGLYRYAEKPDRQGRNWIPLTDHFRFAERNYFGIESVAVDPQDPDTVYMAAGTYRWAGEGRLFKSTDAGATWRPLPLETPMEANGAWRGTGERLAIDPDRPSSVYFGSRDEGLWRSRDGGTSWQQLAQLPAGDENGVGVPVVLFGPASRLYACVFGVGVFVSEDEGDTWQALKGPAKAVRAAATRSGELVVAAVDGVHLWRQGGWIDVSPVKGVRYGAVAVSPHQEDLWVVSEAGARFRLPIHVTRNGGRSWRTYTVQNRRIKTAPDVPWWTDLNFAGATAQLAFDPVKQGQLWLVDWFGTWFTENVDGRRQTWRTLESGHEETVTMTLIAPPAGAPLLSGMVDVNGFRHENFDAFPQANLSDVSIWNTFGLDYHAQNPNWIVRAGTKGDHGADNKSGTVALSVDNGRSWIRLPWPHGLPMKVAYSAKDTGNFVVVEQSGGVYATRDQGRSWTPAAGVGEEIIDRYWHWSHPLAADRVIGHRFYLFDRGRFLISDDGGLTFEEGPDLPKDAWHFVEAAPGMAGHVWISLDEQGLLASEDGGQSFVRLETVDRAYLFGFGKPRRAGDFPAVYLYGRLEGRDRMSIYRSDDRGQSWIEIADPANPIGNWPTILRGDQQTWGRVYIGTNGRGIFLGEPPTASRSQ